MGMGGWALGLPSLPKCSVDAARACVSQRRPCVYSRRLEMTIFAVAFRFDRIVPSNLVLQNAGREITS